MPQRTPRAVLLGLLLLSVPTLASVVIAQTLEEMARMSPVIVRASVGSMQSTWTEDQHSIETWVELQVTDVLKGKVPKGATLIVRNPGGVVGNIGARVAGAPKFTPGEDTLLFLEPAADTPNVWLVSALAAGKISLSKNQFGELRATRDTRGIAFYEPGKGAPKYREVARPEDLGTPAELIGRIKRAVSR